MSNQDFRTAELIPVSEWVYDLWKVTYWTKDPDAGGSKIRDLHLASSNENRLHADAGEHAPYNCEWMTWERIRENVGHPRVIGNLHGLNVYEDSRSHASRIL